MKYMFSCEVCHMPHLGQQNLNAHMRTHRKSFDNECSSCFQRFKKKNELEKHKLIHLEKEIVFECPHLGCTKGFTQRFNYNRHLRTIHNSEGGARTFSCATCSKCFYRKSNLSDHM